MNTTFLQRYRFVFAYGVPGYCRSFWKACRETGGYLLEGGKSLLAGLLCLFVITVLGLPLMLFRCFIQPLWIAGTNRRGVESIMKGAALLALCAALTSCKNEIFGLTRAERFSGYGAILTVTGEPAWGAVASGAGRYFYKVDKNPLATPVQPR